jgi:hypothetical protein
MNKKIFFYFLKVDIHPQMIYNNHALNAPLAQLVEQMTLNHWVHGSSP